MKSIISGFKAARLLKRAASNLDRPEVKLYIPPEICRETPSKDLPEALLIQLTKVVDHLTKMEFEPAAAIVEASYRRRNMLTPTYYEHELLLEPFNQLAQDNGGSTLEAKDLLDKTSAWRKRAPNCPYAAGFYMLCCIQVAFAYRGTAYGHDVSETGHEKFDDYAALGTQAAAETHERLGHHWMWRKAHLKLALIDHKSERDAWRRFDAALQAQPASSEIVATFTHHLLPRWYGDFDQLSRLCNRVLAHPDRTVGCSLYEDILLYLHAYEEGEFFQLSQPEIWAERARHCVAEGGDANLTRAVWLFFWACEYRNVLDTLAQVKVFHADAWVSVKSLEYCISLSLESLKDEWKAAG